MDVKDIDLQRVLHIYNVETLYAAVVEGYVEWRTALVEAVVRAELSGAVTLHPDGHELCVRRLANLLQMASSYREGREWSCECHYCRFLAGVRNYLAHEPLAKLPGDWGWAQSSALLVNTIALDRRLDILSGEPAARRR